MVVSRVVAKRAVGRGLCLEASQTGSIADIAVVVGIGGVVQVADGTG